MGANHPVLIGCRRRPLGGGLLHGEAGEGDIAHPLFRGVEAVAADVDLHVFRVGVRPAEVGVDNRAIALLLRVPLIEAGVLLPGEGENLRFQNLVQRQHLIHSSAVEIDLARVNRVRGKIPVSGHNGGIGVIAAEQTVADSRNPGIAPIGLPAFHRLGAGNDRFALLRAAVDNPGLRRSGVGGIDVFAVDSGGDNHFVPGFRELCRLSNRFERTLLRTGAASDGRSRDINVHSILLILDFDVVFV